MIGLFASVVALLILAGLALMMRDVYRQQAKRDAARLNSFRLAMLSISVSAAPFVAAMGQMARASADLERAVAKFKAAMGAKR